MSKIGVPTVLAQDKKWRAESDCNTLAEARAITGDPSRMKAAAMAAKKMIDTKQTELRGLKQVARKTK